MGRRSLDKDKGRANWGKKGAASEWGGCGKTKPRNA